MSVAKGVRFLYATVGAPASKAPMAQWQSVRLVLDPDPVLVAKGP
jgi:hypothetical protein